MAFTAVISEAQSLFKPVTAPEVSEVEGGPAPISASPPRAPYVPGSGHQLESGTSTPLQKGKGSPLTL